MTVQVRAPRSTRLKLRRAAEHFTVLKREVENFFKANANSTVFNFEPNPDTGDIRIRDIKPLPVEWSLLVGDCIYNLRSALDHLVWAMILRHGGTPTPSTEFPIFLDGKDYLKTDKRNRPARGSGLSKIAGLPNGAAAEIERIQPYNRTDGPPDLHPLWLLHEISNEDKHHLLNMVVMSMQHGVVFIEGMGHGRIERFTLPVGVLEEGAVVHTIRPMLGYRFEREVKMNFNITPGVAFSPEGPGRGMPAIEVLGNIHNFIMTELLPPLRPFVL